MCGVAENLVNKGRAEGRAEGKVEALLSLVKDGLLALSEAAKRAGMSEEEMKKLI